MSLSGSALNIEKISVVYEIDFVLRNLSLDVGPEEFVALLGPSGAGKSTLLRAIMKEVPLKAGNIRVPERIGFAPQRSPMLPWLTVLENVELARPRSVDQAEFRKRATDVLIQAGLGDHLSLKGHKLSGGMRSRVNLIRAFLMSEPVLLLDEPFIGLDAVTRDALHDLTLRLWTEVRPATIFVTHDLDEAIKLANRLVVLAGNGTGFTLDRYIGQLKSGAISKGSYETLKRDIYGALQ